ncbi:MAG: hypothetical protein O9289_17505 [Rhodobacteraceae bacterium]|nr:hypothetical protein [Paracoccaceae bacterium]MCZ8084998.1 hypothetical protein [Paracoccaceae bacterium]
MNTRHIPDCELNSALQYAAKLVLLRGRDVPMFVDIFTKLEALSEERKQKESAIERARRMAGLM